VKRGWNIWKAIGRLGVGAALLTWVFHMIFVNEGRRYWSAQGHRWSDLSRWEQWRVAWSQGPRELWHTLELIPLSAFAVSLLFMGMTILLGMLRWRMVLKVQGIGLSLGRTAEISLVAHFANSFMLGSTGGDLLKAYYAARETHHKKTEAVITVFVDRLLGLFAMLLFAGLMMVPNVSLLWAHRRLGALAGFVLLMLLGCAALVGLAFWGQVPDRWPRVRQWLTRVPRADLFERVVEATRLFGRDGWFIARTLAISMALNVFCVLQILALAGGLGLRVPAVFFFVIVPIIVCVSALPISPSGLGVRENLYVLTLSTPELGVDHTLALSLSLLAYAGSLIWSAIGGIVYAARKERHRLPAIKEVNGLPGKVSEV
jgi:hypothetical protein